MGVNKEKNYPLYVEALQLKLQGKSYDEIAKIQEIGKTTAYSRVQLAKVTEEQEGTIDMSKLADMMLVNTIGATEVETDYVRQVKDKKDNGNDIDPNEIAQIEKIKTSSQKIHAFLQGDNAKKDGGERRPMLELTESQLQKLANGNSE